VSCGLQATGVLCCEYTCSQLEFSLVGFMSCERDLTVIFPGGPWSTSSPLRPCIYTLCLDNRTAVEKTTLTHTHTPVSPFTLCPGLVTTRVSQYQKGKTNLDFTETRDSEWQWHQLGHMQVCTYLRTDNHASTPPPSFLQAGCPSCHQTNSVEALKAEALKATQLVIISLLDTWLNRK